MEGERQGWMEEGREGERERGREGGSEGEGGGERGRDGWSEVTNTQTLPHPNALFGSMGTAVFSAHSNPPIRCWYF